MSLLTDIAAYWRFNEGSGTTVADATGNGNTGTLVGTLSWVSGFVSGEGAVKSVAGPNYVSLSGTPGASLSQPFSVLLHANSASVTATQTIFSEGSSSSDNPVFGFLVPNAPNGKMHLLFRNDAGSSLIDQNGSIAVFDGNNHTILFRCDGSGNYETFIDGVEDTSLSGTFTPSGTLTLNRSAIGALARTSYTFPCAGTYGSVGKWTRRLTDDEIAELYNSGAGLPYDDFGSGDIIVDIDLATETDSAFDITPVQVPVFSVDGSNNLVVSGAIVGDWDVGIRVTDAKSKTFDKTFTIHITDVPVAPTNTVLPAISGTPTSGHVLTSSSGTWTGTAPISYGYQWNADGTPISGATSSSFTLTDTQIGAVMTCTVTATNGGGSTPATSAGTSPVSPGGVTTLATMTLQNTSASDLPVGSITPIFGHLFQEGDVPSGEAPQFQLTDGTNVPYSMSLNTKTHAGGSLFHAAFMLRLPVGIPASSSLSIKVLNGGTAPSASGRSLSDFAAGSLDLNVTVTGLDNLSGDWSSNLNQGIGANGAAYQYMDGDAGAVWRVPAAFRQSGADHGQLEGWWYVAALQDGSGNLAGIRHLTRIVQPYYNVASPAPNFRSFSAAGLYNGASQLSDLAALFPSPAAFTWTSGVNLNATANGFESGMLCQLTTTGTLPGGLSTGQSYCTYHTGTNTFAIGLNFSSVVSNGTVSCITPTDAGTGTHTCTLYPFISQFGSIWTAQEDGRWNYAQGNGSVADDPAILVQPDMAYWQASGALPPYALSDYSVTSNPTYNYFPDTAGPVIRFISQTGERNDVGPLPSWYVRHIFTGAAVDERAVRVIGLIGAHLPVCLKDSSTNAIPVVNSGTYSGMPVSNTNFRWYGQNPDYSGIIAPANTNVFTQGWSNVDFSHIVAFSYYPYVLTGEPQFMDMVVEYGNIAVYSAYPASGNAIVSGTESFIGGSRNAVINGTTYTGCIFFGDDLLRAMAWPIRELSSTQILPDNNPENASYNSYFSDMLSDTYSGLNDYVGMLTAGTAPYVTDNGLFLEDSNGGGGLQSSWTMSYLIGANALAYGLTKSSGSLSFLNYMIKWPVHVYNSYTAWAIPYYHAMGRQNGTSCIANGCKTPYITSDEQFAIGDWFVTWDSGTGLFTLQTGSSGNLVSANYAMQNGDMLMWNGTIDGIPPSGFSGDNVPYYVVNKSGSGLAGTTFQLSTTPGGSPIVLSDTQATKKNVYGMPASPPSGYAGDNGGFSSDGYLANLTGILGWSNALGATVDTSMLSDMQALITGSAGYVADYEDDPKYAMTSSY